jgi:hypothetical protein
VGSPPFPHGRPPDTGVCESPDQQPGWHRQGPAATVYRLPHHESRRQRRRRANSMRTVLTLLALTVTLPIDVAVVTLSMVCRSAMPRRAVPRLRRTVLVTGGKMTKALQLCRSFHDAGCRVILVESPKNRMTGHRFSSAVDAFYCVPESTDPEYFAVMIEIVRYECVDVVVPVSTPASSVADAHLRDILDGICDVVHGRPDTVSALDDKAHFAYLAAALGLPVPHSVRITNPRQIDDFDFPQGRSYLLKRIAYDPVGRTNLTLLNRKTPGCYKNSSKVRSTAPTARCAMVGSPSTRVRHPRQPN